MRYGGLTQEQARFYRDQGYYRLLDCFDQTETAEMRDFISSEFNKTQDRVDPSNPNRKLYGLYDRNPELMNRVLGKKALIGALTSILGPNVVFVKNRHNHATVNNRYGSPAEGMHRDILQPTRGLVTAAVYLQDSTVGNGATRVIPGSHNLPYVGVPQADGGGTWLAEHEEFAGLENQAVPVPMNEGDVLLFNGTLFHGVGYNPSGETRTSMTLGFRSVDELDAQPDHSRQIVVAGDYIYRGNDR
ncbi:MAG TPA: phytanoyl-CoA dioxygenase family protein [Candidatus Saccharimonadales bacterium]|nr:phytanoyl-CoA dioxygenase family protein [Candidatus Saccharimonadales bacterium]